MPGISLINDSGTRVDNFGVQFTAAVGTDPLSVIADFTLEGTPPDAWTNWGHFSSESLPTWQGQSGDATALGTYLRRNVRSLPGDSTTVLEVTHAQSDAKLLQRIAEAVGKPMSLLWLFLSENNRYAWWIPSATPAVTQLPTPSMEKFTETKTQWAFNSPPAGIDLVTLQTAHSDDTAILPSITSPLFMVIGPGLFDAEAGTDE